MNIVNKLTLRQLKMNKRRTLVTIIGAIISVAMIMAVMVSMSSAMDLMKRVTISTKGNWHMAYYEMAAGQLDILETDENIDQIAINYPQGFALITDEPYANKPYLMVDSYNQAAFEQMPIKLIEGRLPNNENEIVIPEHLSKLENFEYKIGDTITLEVGNRYGEISEGNNGLLDVSNIVMYDNEGKIKEQLAEVTVRTYTITGIIEKSRSEYSWGPGYIGFTYVDAKKLSPDAEINAFVLLKELYPGIYKENALLGEKLGLQAVVPNSELLACYGVNSDSGLITSLFSVVGIVLVIIMVGSVSLIYNAFAISVAERSQYLGMLSSIGATKTQKRNSVFFEGAIIGGISIPFGLVAGFVGMGITFSFINNMFKNVMGIEENLTPVVSPMVILITIAIAAVTIFISTYLPAKRASKITAIEAIRQTHDIKINSKRLKTSKLTRLFFGFEGELALKNLKRNGRRYRATLFSLVISIILFLTTATFSAYMTQSLEMMVESANYDFVISAGYQDKDFKKETLNQVAQLEEVKEYNLVSSAYASTYLPEEMTSDFAKEQSGDGVDERGYYHSVEFYILEDEAFKTYTEQQKVDLSQVNDLEYPGVLVLNRTKYKDKKTKKYKDEPVIHAQVGDTLTLDGGEWNEETNEYKEVTYGKVAIAGFVTNPPLGISIQEATTEIKLIVSRSVYETFWANYEGNLEDIDASEYVRLFLTSDDVIALQEKLEGFQEEDTRRFHIYSIYEEKQTSEQMQTIMKTFIYGFIVLITAISVANIFNTISTSIALRKREFAMLRSVGMTPKGFNKMINFESIFYGLKALLYGLPVSFGIMIILYNQLGGSFDFDFFIPMQSVATVIVSVFVVVGLAMFYSGAKVKGQNIIEGLKDSNL